MSTTLLFCAVFASQIAVITGFLSSRAAMTLRYVLKHCPPATHPRLYPMPRQYYERSLRRFKWLNVGVGVFGLGIIAAMLVATLRGEWDGELYLPWSASGDWDAAIIIPFFLLQMVPSLYFDASFTRHFKALALTDPPRQRSGELSRRRWVDLISPAMLATTLIVQGVFVAFLLDYRHHGYPWFTAAGNIAGIAALDALLLVLVVVALYARRVDHLETDRARRARLQRFVRPTWILSIATPVLVTVQLLMKIDASHVPDFVVASIFVQAIAIASRWAVLVHRPAQPDFDVYRQDAGAHP